MSRPRGPTVTPHMSIPDWDSEDLFVGVRVEGS
jgi:hypothetical protein